MKTKNRLFFLPFLVALLLPQTVKADHTEDTWLYMVTQQGIDELNIEMPIFDDENFNGWVDDGKVFVTPEGGSKETLIYYRSFDPTGDNGEAKIKKGVEGVLTLHRSKGWHDATITTSYDTYTIPFEPGQSYGKLYFTWKVPARMRGKQITISWQIHKTGNGSESDTDINIGSSKFTLPAAPEVVQPSLMDPMLSYDPMHAGQIMMVYTMAASNIKSLSAEYLEVNGKQESYKKMPLENEMSGYIFLDADKCYKNFVIRAKYVDSEGNTIASVSDPIMVPALQLPVGLSASLQADGSVLLSWRKSYPKWQDIQDGDLWDIQRNTTGALNADSKWTSLSQVPLSGDSIYTFTDNNLLDAYEGQPVYYRVRRASMSAWSWTTGYYAQAALPSVIKLSEIKSATVKRGIWEDTRHIANLTFAFGSSQYDSQGRFVLRTAADWEAFAKLINNGEKTELNAIMANDIDLGDSQTKIGVSAHPFSGTFDGNGHVLTVHYNETSGDYAAPFAYVGNKAASFKNLQVTGTIFTTSKFASGFVGETMKDVNFNNCRSSVSITCHVDGDASAGGFMGRCRAGITTLTDCLFDGEFHDSGAVGFGGLVGWSETVPVITNCLVNPTVLDIDDSYKSCQTFARTRNGFTINNSYFTTSMNGAETYRLDDKEYTILRNNNDWLNLVEKVAAGTSSLYYVIMMSDFEITEPIGKRNDVPFVGTFEGNGHTLIVNIDGGSEDYMAPFYYARSSTFNNLNVQGTVKGGKYSAGLIGNGKTQNMSQSWINNCHVSVDVYTTDKYAGGIVGYGGNTQFFIKNCMFDGTINAATYDVNSYAGAIMGWEDGGTSNVISNCFENGTYLNFEKVAMNFNAKDGGHAYGADNCWNSHGWKECNSAVGLTPEALISELGSDKWMVYGSSVLPKQTQYSLDEEGDASGMSLSSLSGKLGKQWQVSGNTVVPILTVSTDDEYVPTVWDKSAKVVLNIDKSVDGEVRYTERRELTDDEVKIGKMDVELITSCVNHDFRIVVEKGKSKLVPVDTVGIVVTKTETGEEASYEYNSNVQLSDLEAATQQSTVLLTWKTTGNGDFFRITRRDKATDRVDTLEANCQQTTYLDQKPQPQHVYIYTVEGVNNCEGEHVSTVTKEGWCEPTGMVRGYIRLTDGTALSGVKVKAEPQGDTMGETGTAITDDTGFFEIKGLQYTGTGTYLVTAESTGDEGAFTTFYANFDDHINLVTNANLVQNKYYLLTGYVMYEGTSVPVVGAQFERDGIIVHNGSGKPIITDSQGRFSVSIPQGSHNLRVVKDGHVFVDGGFYTDPDAQEPTRPNWQKSVYGYVFWDQTKVTLQGRVVGGDTQGSMPLGELASTNNLGDSLTIVMQLEGDNASWLVRDQLNASLTERHEDYYFATNQLDTCHMDAYRHRLVIKPSPVTGEYCVPMLPVKYKVTEIYAEGYPTLFQAGKVGETIDLSSYVMGDTATYSRIYHSTPTLAVEQFNMMGEKYLGIKDYNEIDNTGKKALVELWNDSTGYSFGYPVFMANSPIIMMLSAEERYYYNNDIHVGAPDIVHLNGGEVLINNGLVDSSDSYTLPLDTLGSGYYRFTPQNTTFTEEGDMALKTLTMTLLYDGTYYDVLPMNGEPIRGYVMAAKAKSQGRRLVADGGTFVIDVLRDPPGAGSSAYIESGSKFNYSFSASLSAAAGINLSFKRGDDNYNRYDGVWEGEYLGKTGGSLTSTKNETLNSLPITMGYYQGWQYDYTFENSERISTSSSVAGVGRDADVFIGMTQSAVMEDAIAVRAINADTYNLLTTHEGGTFKMDGVDFKVRLGTMKVLAEGVNSKGEKVYLVRDEVVSAYTQLKSTFAHSQAYIENELIPEMINIRNSLMLPKGTDEQTAQQVADQAGHAVYISKVANDDVRFAVDANYYTQVNPTGMECNDSVNAINENVYAWIGYLSKNEQEKLEATEKVNTYEVDGRTSISYGETFNAASSQKRYMITPLSQNINIGPGFGGDNAIANMVQYISDKKKEKNAADSIREVEISGFGKKIVIKCQVILSLNYNYNFGKSDSYAKKIGFTLAPSLLSNLVVDVYRTKLLEDELEEKINDMKEAGYTDEQLRSLFFQIPSEDYLDGVCGIGDSNAPMFLSYYDTSKPKYSSFVYRTRGGATRQPYEDERRTKYYNAGQVLDAKTVSIDNLKIWTEQASVSNVPYDEPARFTINLANESTIPAMTASVIPFNLYLEDSSNPKGAKIMVEGRPLTANGQDIYLVPGEVVKKGIEIYPSQDFDYEDITLSLYDPSDLMRVYSCKLSAHFVPTAGKVNISLPGDKWVVNTESQYDNNKQQYYMPVRIDGFDVNYRNFDHIELQYKLSTQGDKEWVSVCSYYKSDSLMAKATGECKLIEEDGKIMAIFWGESDPIEQTYDIRAVNYCRYGNGFLTRSSNILTGIKDTRRPQLFGTPEPEDGILGIGENILLRFSENIAGNYLRDLNNFQVLGQTNSTNISLSTDLHFGIGEQAESMSSRNLSSKSFTVDVMLNPDPKDMDMIFFSHGEGSEQLELGVSKEHYLTATFKLSDSQNGPKKVKFTSTSPVDFNGLHQVQFVFQSDQNAQTTTVIFYDGTKEIGTFTLPSLYGGTGRYYLGTRINGNMYVNSGYSGEMLEFRLWNRALSIGEMNDYHLKRLTGYELGLMDNYPLNEGSGDYSYNRTHNGGDLKIIRGTWKMPDGIGMLLDGKNGFRIENQKFERSDYQDYSLMFWFRTDDNEGTLLSNGAAKDEAGYKDHFNFDVHDGMLDLWLGGSLQSTATKVNDGQWHHVALTVSRSRNVGNLYVDASLKKTFPVDALGGIHGNNLAAGATYLDANTAERHLNGHIDEIGMYEMALSENIIKSTATLTPSGEEVGLLAYLSFGRNELQLDNTQRLMPSGISLKRYYDATTGEYTNQCDTLVSQQTVDLLGDKTEYAPMRGLATLENIKYSYVAKDNEMYINLDVPSYAIEKTNVTVTVKDVADLNGNVMASPVTMDLYIYRNPLRWNIKQLSKTVNYGEESTFEVVVQNLSGKSKRFSIEGLPLWITASEYNGVVGPLGEQPITFTISSSINIGDFDEIISLVGDEGMTEPLPVTLKVRGEKPDWAVDDDLLGTNISMSIVAQVTINESEVAHDSEDMLAAFDENHRLMGLAHLHPDPTSAGVDALAYLNVYNTDYTARQLFFEFFDASTGIIHRVSPMPEGTVITFKSDTIMGTTTSPIAFVNDANSIVQAIPLKKGWNWVSFNVKPGQATVKQLLNNATQWQVGDAFEADNADGSHYLISYKAITDPRNPSSVNYVWDYSDVVLAVNPCLMYRFYSVDDKLAYIAGSFSSDTIVVRKGWNRIGYSSLLNLPLGLALAEYTDKGTVGDIIKSQSEFAILTEDAMGNRAWKGTLEFLRVGEGYMLKRNADGEVSFSYPQYNSSGTQYNRNVSSRQVAFENVSGTSMTVVATASGVEVQPGYRLMAYRGGELCGVAEADQQGVFYLNMGDVDTASGDLTFTLECDGELIAATARTQMSYKPNAALGTPDEPTAISFIAADNFEAEGWYTLSGIKLQKRPTIPGVYIHNNQKHVIK